MEDIVRIPLKRRDGTTYIAIIDAADWPLVKDYKWYAFLTHATKRSPNAKTRIYVLGWKGGASAYLHRLIMDCPSEMKVDHKDGDGLNNRRSNLRVCSNVENTRNSTLSSRVGKTSRYKGVGLVKHTGKWNARIHVDGKNVALGYFEKESDAARAYDEAAVRFFGEFAATNETLGLYPTEEYKGSSVPLAA
jgi:hypothetical protein